MSLTHLFKLGEVGPRPRVTPEIVCFFKLLIKITVLFLLLPLKGLHFLIGLFPKGGDKRV